MTGGIPPAQQCTLPSCGREATNPSRPGALCEQHRPAGSHDDAPPEDEAEVAREGGDGTWTDADFSTPVADVWPEELLEREQWMGHVDKRPFAPWADRDHPEAKADKDARWKWGLSENYVDGERAKRGTDDPRLDGVCFLQQEDDPYLFVDGDDVRCPQTKEIHPAFRAFLELLGVSYADISTSGTGVHVHFRGEIPIDRTEQVSFEIDSKPWGSQ